MQKRIRVGFGLCLLAGLTACAKVPENKTVEATRQAELPKEDVQCDTIQNVIKQAKEFKGIQCDNLYFSQQFEVNEPEEIGLLEY